MFVRAVKLMLGDHLACTPWIPMQILSNTSVNSVFAMQL